MNETDKLKLRISLAKGYIESAKQAMEKYKGDPRTLEFSARLNAIFDDILTILGDADK